MGIENRRIKFRAWDNEQKKMHFDIQDVYDSCDGTYCNTFGDFLSDITKPQRFHVMQYTGLEDQHIQDIYEGDIIEVEGLVAEVIFKEGSFYYHAISIDTKKWIVSDKHKSSRAYVSFSELTLSDWKVIGNIYQNKDLLNKK